MATNDLSQNLAVNTEFLLPNLLWEDVINPQDALLKAFKVKYADADKVQYDQWDSPYGITQYRGLGADPPRVKFGSFQKFEIDPGYWGEFTLLQEEEITRGRKPGTLADPMVVSQISNFFCLNFATRIISLIRKAIADVIRTGIFMQTGKLGQQFAYQLLNYNNMVSPAIPWKSQASQANPIIDQIGWKAQFQKGSSNYFGKGSVLLANSFTIQDLFRTAGYQSTYRGPYGSSVLGIDGSPADVTGMNEIQQYFDLPNICPYDFGYFNTLADAQANNQAAFNYIIPNQTLIWIGQRPNSIVGEFQLTRHAGLIEKGDAAKYPNADDQLEGIEAVKEGLYVRAHYQNHMPHQYKIEAGFNGSPIVGYPGAVAAITYT